MHSLPRRIVRQIIYQIFKHSSQTPWKLLRHYPHIIPADAVFHKWQQSEWPEYQQWINHHAVTSTRQWLQFHQQAKALLHAPRISIVTPVYNTDSEILRTCIFSVRTQTSPFWELVLVDDGSTNPATLEVLASAMCRDPRIHVLKSLKENTTGISAATNRGIEYASGDYILFLDHDDRLAPEAVQAVASALCRNPQPDIIYSDRDMISPDNKRFMHLMKPDWSPDNLYSGNYIFHLMCYRKQLLAKVGKLYPEYDGSQDYDLILRCMEQHPKPKVHHIPQVLYHWRQHQHSVALADNAKSYAFDAGMRALQKALLRRNITATVTEDQTLPRGIYQVHLPLAEKKNIDTVILKKDSCFDQYRATLLASAGLTRGTRPYILILHEEYRDLNEDSPAIMASWLTMEATGMVCGRVLDSSGRIAYAGMTYTAEGKRIIPYLGSPANEAGYMAVTQTLRNISAPDPLCVAIRRELWEQLGGFNQEYDGPHALLDFSLRAIEKNWRIVYNPRAMFSSTTDILKKPFPKQDKNLFIRQWKDWLRTGDPYYSPNISQKSQHYKLASFP